MAKTITFNNGEEDVTLTVQDVMSYTYNAMRTVLKIHVSEEDQSFAEISELKKCTGRITYKVDDEVVSEYTGYNKGVKGFTANWKDGLFDIELEKMLEEDNRLTQIEATLDFILTVLIPGEPEDEEDPEQLEDEEDPEQNESNEE